ncbi:MAG: bacillithiol biosynthesis deacetylase BshB1 [Chloroflexi bacterium]|nr:bacillithiol biosynthesis deacetylase BshB1 [Chloroflexota bacterium]
MTREIDRPLDILAFAPHPDDAELGCAGSLILAADQGLRVAIADLTEGERASRGTPEKRAREKERAADLLGLCERFSLGLPDTKIGTDPAQRLPVIQLIRETRPRVVLAPYGIDRHPDHVAANKLVRDACFFAGVKNVGMGCSHRPERVYQYMIHHPFSPNFVIDVSLVWERRMAAVMAYASQFHSGLAVHDKCSTENGPDTVISQPSFLRFVEARAIYYGAMVGAAYGEPFYMPGPVPLREFPNLVDPRPLPGKLPAYSMY